MNYVHGVTSDIQTQLDSKFASSSFNSSFDTRLAAKSTSNLTEGTNLYYTDSRARQSVSAGTGITYNNTTGVISTDSASANTASKVVIRDSSGNFSAGTISAELNGNAATVTNGVYTTDTGTVTNTMLAGSIANAKLANSAVTLGGTSVSLGGSYTAQNMLDAIKTVDGSGSGLDADTLDGHDTSYFRINIYDSSGTLLN